ADGSLQTYTYDTLGRRVSTIDCDGTVNDLVNGACVSGNILRRVDTGYDALGHVTTSTLVATQASMPGVTLPLVLSSQAYDPSGLAKLATYTYSADDHILTTKVSGTTGTSGGTALLSSAESTYNAAGKVTSQTVINDSAALPAGWWRLNEAAGTVATDASGS